MFEYVFLRQFLFLTVVAMSALCGLKAEAKTGGEILGEIVWRAMWSQKTVPEIYASASFKIICEESNPVLVRVPYKYRPVSWIFKFEPNLKGETVNTNEVGAITIPYQGNSSEENATIIIKIRERSFERTLKDGTYEIVVPMGFCSG